MDGPKTAKSWPFLLAKNEFIFKDQYNISIDRAPDHFF
jgi:hypothetical protein